MLRLINYLRVTLFIIYIAGIFIEIICIYNFSNNLSVVLVFFPKKIISDLSIRPFEQEKNPTCKPKGLFVVNKYEVLMGKVRRTNKQKFIHLTSTLITRT